MEHVVDILVGMRADMKIAGYFFDGKGANESAAILVFKGFFDYFIVFHLVWLFE
jgi:hypothetical protein